MILFSVRIKFFLSLTHKFVGIFFSANKLAKVVPHEPPPKTVTLFTLFYVMNSNVCFPKSFHQVSPSVLIDSKFLFEVLSKDDFIPRSSESILK